MKNIVKVDLIVFADGACCSSQARLRYPNPVKSWRHCGTVQSNNPI